MRPIKTDYSNITFTAPGCFDLPATVAQRADGAKEVETVWELNDNEIAQITKDRKLYLYIMGGAMPPVYLSVRPELVPKDPTPDPEPAPAA